MEQGKYTITIDDQNGYVHVLAQGEFHPPLGDEMISKARKTAAEHGYPILCDVRESVTKVTLTDWFFLPRRLWVYLDAKTRGIRTAIVMAGGEQERTYRFFETVTSNLGMDIRIFLDEDEAKNWLSTYHRKKPKNL